MEAWKKAVLALTAVTGAVVVVAWWISRVKAPPPPPTITLYASADSFVDEEAPHENYGGFGSMSVGTKKNMDRRSFIKFDLTALPAGAVIRSAKLRLYCWYVSDLVAGVTDIQACRVSDDTWTETGITWRNQPAYGVVEDTKAPVVNTWIEWDITRWVQNEWAGDKVVSICLKCVVEDYDGIYRFSKHRTRSWKETHLRPELYIYC